MKSLGFLSITFIVTISVLLPSAYAEEWNFFDWLTNLFGGEVEKNESDILDESQDKQADIKKAVIIDQLDRDIPNQYFQMKFYFLCSSQILLIFSLVCYIS